MVRALVLALLLIFAVPSPLAVETVPEVAPTIELSATGQEMSNPVKLPEVSRGNRAMQMECTAYTHTGNRTATGTWPARGTIAADPNVLKAGTRVYIPGYGEGIVADTGGDIKGDRLDLFMESRNEAISWGRQALKVRILE